MGGCVRLIVWIFPILLESGGPLFYRDEGVSFPVHQGIQASRSDIKYFKHNDMQDLERLLKLQAIVDKQVGPPTYYSVAIIVNLTQPAIWSWSTDNLLCVRGVIVVCQLNSSTATVCFSFTTQIL